MCVTEHKHIISELEWVYENYGMCAILPPQFERRPSNLFLTTQKHMPVINIFN